MSETLSSGNSSTKLAQIAELARRHPERVFSSLHHVIDVVLLREAFRLTRKDGAPGVDGQKAEEYGRDLENNLASLLTRLRKGTYYAPPVKRVHIPKGDGRTRPIGIPTFEDKVLQRAVAMVLGAIYEQDFHPGSYGFRPGRSAHDALQAIWEATTRIGGGWVLEVDIRAFFDTLDHGALRGFLDKRVSDGVIRRAIDKWLKAGVLEDGVETHPEEGTPQGGVVSPVLANVYLHEVLDVWFERQANPGTQHVSRLAAPLSPGPRHEPTRSGDRRGGVCAPHQFRRDRSGAGEPRDDLAAVRCVGSGFARCEHAAAGGGIAARVSRGSRRRGPRRSSA
jgi:RNA-directed DNA polymerase